MCFAHVRSAAVSLHVDNEHSVLFNDNTQRCFQLEAVKSFNILGMLPFNFFEEPNRRRLFRMLNKDIKVEELHNKKVKMCYCSPTRVVL